MAAASSLTQVADEECCTHIADDEFRDIVREGRKFTRYLLYTVEELDAALGETSHTYQSHERHYFKTLLNQWDAHVETARTVITIQAISEALGSLFVGRADHDDISYLIPRKISQKVFPEGHNIPITMVQDNTHGRYEAIFNVFDGIIIVTHLERPDDAQNSKLDYLGPLGGKWKSPSDVIGAAFTRLHTGWLPTSDALVAATDIAVSAVSKAIVDGSQLPSLPLDIVGSWLPAALAGQERVGKMKGISKNKIETEMRPWLNYIAVHVQADRGIESILKRCLPSACGGKIGSWQERETFRIGHWAFYALLGAKPGRDVAWMLAKRKNNWGHKAVKSITMFSPDIPCELNVEEHEQFCNPVLLFEVVSANDGLRAIRRDLEVYWAWSSTLASSPTVAWCPTLACQEWMSDYSEADLKQVLSMESCDRVLSLLSDRLRT